MSLPLTQQLVQALRLAVEQATRAGKLGSLTPEQAATVPLLVEVPNDTSYGDYASPSALGMAKLCRLAPAKIANEIAAAFSLADVQVSVAGAGFINFRLDPVFLEQALRDLLAQGDEFGKTKPDKPEKILLEFVSANPTGPLHVGHGRWAAAGSTLSNLLKWAGHQVDCEFYINDAGNQMQLLGSTLEFHFKRLRGELVKAPEGIYQGSYMMDLAKKLWTAVFDRSQVLPTTTAEFTDYAYQEMLSWQQATLHNFQTDFEHWFSERQLHAPDPITGLSPIQQSLQELEERGCLFRAKAPRQKEPTPDAEEAIFFKTEEFGDDQDRVVQKADGSTTYFAADIAYHRDKVRRGYDRLINILGSDHHGYIGRLQAAVGSFSQEVKLEILIGQFVKLFQVDPATQEKIEVKMSKRSGKFVALNDLIDDEEIGVGVDAARWFLLSNSMDSQINFDLDLAKDHLSLNNPVVYAQYSHARCCTLLRRIQEEFGITIESEAAIIDPNGDLLFTEPEERILLMRLLMLPDELRLAAQERAPHKGIRFVESVASDLNKFYDKCRIFPLLNENPPLALARLHLIRATRLVLSNLLVGILGISAPTSL